MESHTASPVLSARAERRAVVALFAVFALLVQALMPAAAFANANRAGGMVICTASGAAQASAPGKAPPTHHHETGGCDHCLCPLAAAPPPALAAAVAAPVRYAQAVAADLSSTEGLAPGRGLAAPPPPSRGPPRIAI